MPVRQATKDDLVAITEMGSQFLGRTKYASLIKPHAPHISATLERLLESGAIFVAEIDGVVRGFIACSIVPAWFNPEIRIALEMAWWMEPDARGRPEGMRLLFAFERWAKEQDAQVICMSDISLEDGSPAGSILERLGYSVSERTFLKDLTNVQPQHPTSP